MNNLNSEVIQRVVAKIIDVALALMVSQHSVPGIILGTTYIFIADGIFDGRSVGKKLMKLKVMKLSPEGNLGKIQFIDSILRNGVFGVLLFLSCLPLIKYVAYLVTMIVVGIELYFIYFDPKRIRLGDIYAETVVVAEAT